MRRVLVALFGHLGDKQAMAAGLTIASRHGGEVTAVHVASDPYDTVPIAGEGMSANFIQSAIDAAKEQAAKRLEVAEEAYKAAVSEFDGQGETIASWLVEAGRPQQVYPRLARLSDLTVIGGLAPQSEPTRHIAFEALLFASARPILLVPSDHSGSVGTRVVIGWNDTPEATHAVGASIDLLQRADAVDVLSADGDAEEANNSQKLTAYLQSHDISATATDVASKRRNVADLLLERCNEKNADLLMIGGYGHSRIGEIIFGGVTHDLLQRYNVPMLVAH